MRCSQNMVQAHQGEPVAGMDASLAKSGQRTERGEIVMAVRASRNKAITASSHPSTQRSTTVLRPLMNTRCSST